MIRPRNSLVVLRLIEKAVQQHGSLIIPATKENFCEAEVMAVGPGTVAAAGGISETIDLKPGQLVFVNHKKPTQGGNTVYAGIPYRLDGKTYFIFEQTQVIGIISDTCAGVAEAYVEAAGNIMTPAKPTIVH
jgi:co-chaperonin GroES (HSP10)